MTSFHRPRGSGFAEAREAIAALQDRAVRLVALGDGRWRVETHAGTHLVDVVRHGGATHVACEGRTYVVPDARPRAGGAAGPVERIVRSPMTGTLVRVDVEAGREVAAGDPLFLVEAMKMEYAVRARFAGVVERVLAKPGGPIALDAPVVEVAPHEAAEPA